MPVISALQARTAMNEAMATTAASKPPSPLGQRIADRLEKDLDHNIRSVAAHGNPDATRFEATFNPATSYPYTADPARWEEEMRVARPVFAQKAAELRLAGYQDVRVDMQNGALVLSGSF